MFLDHRDVYETGFQWVILFMEDLFFLSSNPLSLLLLLYLYYRRYKFGEI